MPIGNNKDSEIAIATGANTNNDEEWNDGPMHTIAGRMMLAVAMFDMTLVTKQPNTEVNTMGVYMWV